MRRWLPWCCLVLAGCSTHPGAGFLDHVFQGKVRVNPQTPPHGGVCVPQGECGIPAAPVAPIAPVTPVPVGAPIFPGAAPGISPAPPGFVPPPPPAPLR